jgi:hypothetical protein
MGACRRVGPVGHGSHGCDADWVVDMITNPLYPRQALANDGSDDSGKVSDIPAQLKNNGVYRWTSTQSIHLLYNPQSHDRDYVVVDARSLPRL